MMESLKDLLTSSRKRSRFARRVSCQTRDLAHQTRDLAHDLAHQTRDLAHSVGPKRGGAVLGVIAAAIGIPLLVRYLRNRSEMEEWPARA